MDEGRDGLIVIQWVVVQFSVTVIMLVGFAGQRIGEGEGEVEVEGSRMRVARGARTERTVGEEVLMGEEEEILELEIGEGDVDVDVDVGDTLIITLDDDEEIKSVAVETPRALPFERPRVAEVPFKRSIAMETPVGEGKSIVEVETKPVLVFSDLN